MPAPEVKKLQCECGSTFFYVVRAEQFTAGGYGTAEFRSMSQAPKTFLVCLCGRPTFPQASSFANGTQAAIAERSFQESAKAAGEAVKARSVNNIAQIAASPAELDEVRQQVVELQQTLSSLGSKEYAVEVERAAKTSKRPRQKASEAR